MKRLAKFFVTLFFVIFNAVIFREWIGRGEISGGDSSFYWQGSISNMPWLPVLWDNTGLGSSSNMQYFYFYLQLPIKILSTLTLNWAIIERAVWFFPFIILTIFSSLRFLKKIGIDRKFAWVGAFAYLYNTYILMIVGGGQVSIFLAYSIIPLIIACGLSSYQTIKTKDLLLFSLVSCLLFSFEPRFAVLGLIISFLFAFYLYGLKFKKIVINILFLFPILIGVNFYWLLPTILFKSQAYSPSLTASNWLDFLSLANFSNSVSLLHPNWPENIFGKTYLMRPEFLIVPIFVFFPLIFMSVRSYKQIFNFEQKKLYFLGILLILTGAFLSKGVNPPFGFLYRLAYENLPIFNTFRDPAKFYFITAIGYLVAIPSVFTFWNIFLSKVFPKRKYFLIMIIIFILSWWYLLKPALSGQLTGTFKTKEIPNEYYQLSNFVKDQNIFFRTLWMPSRQRFGYQSILNPAINLDSYIAPDVCLEPFCSLTTDIDKKWSDICDETNRCYVEDLSFLNNKRAYKLLQDLSVKYIIVPIDPQSEIFISERKYSAKQRDRVVAFCDSISWLTRLEQFKEMAVYEINGYNDLFYIEGETKKIIWGMIGEGKYSVKGTLDDPARIVFSQSYNKYWKLKLDDKVIENEQNGVLSSFNTDKQGDFEGVVEFVPQRYVFYGIIISAITLLACVAGILLL